MPAAQQPQQQGDNSLAPFWIIVGLFALFWSIWYLGHSQIATVVMKIRLYEAYLINLFTPSVSPLIAAIKSSAPADMSFNNLAEVSEAIGNYFKYPVTIILIVLAIVIYFSNPLLRFKKTYTIQTLIDTEKENWPQITPVGNLDLINTDIDEGPWAMALTPMQFAKKYHLLQEERIIPSDPNSLQFIKITASVRKDEAHRIFSLQLGCYWPGIEYLNIHTKALFAIFAAKANRDRDGATKLLMQIASSTTGDKLNFAGTEELLAMHKDQKGIIKITQNHAFILTVMASMLLFARTDGVLATADFLWLKPIDRTLWYMLNSVGRQTPFVEVAGPFAHWLAEKTMRRKLKVPMVDEAVDALEIAVKEVVYTPPEDP